MTVGRSRAPGDRGSEIVREHGVETTPRRAGANGDSHGPRPNQRPAAPYTRNLAKAAATRPLNPQDVLLQVHELVGQALGWSSAAAEPRDARIELHTSDRYSIAGKLLRSTRREFILLTSGRTDCTLEQLAGSSRTGEELVRRDVKVRHVFTEHAFSRPSVRAYASSVADCGGTVRVFSGPIQDAIIVDQRMAVIWGPPHADADACITVRGTIVLDCLVGLANAVWRSAMDLEVHQWLHEDDDLTVKKILYMLAEGAKDDVSARRLGMSVRTYRRYVADIMKRLGADSRFEAGVRAVQLGVLDTARTARPDPAL